MPRLILRNYHRDTNETDIKGLFGKIGNVEDIYIPPPTVTGIVRNFAIVSLSSSEENIQKYLKALNGSNWNGNRISIEMAKEYYKDRLHSEIETQKNLDAVEESSKSAIEYQDWKSPFISLRVKSNAPCVKISTIPGASHEKGIVSCGWKGFDARPVKSKKSSSIVSASIEVPAVVSSTPSSSSAAKQPTTVSTKALEGGGLRKGFGSISIPTVNSSTVATSTANPTRSGDIGASVDCCIDEHDNSPDDLDQIDSRYLEDEYSEPCISTSELTEEVLKAERTRALKVLELVLGGEGPNDDESALTPFRVSTTTATAVKQKAANDGWNSAVIKRFDPSKMISAAVPESNIKVNDVTTEGASNNVTNSLANYAEMNVLKDIFYKEGGVGWNESHTDAVQRSSAVGSDALFLEAEKYGIDVRNTSSTAGGSGDASNLLSFNFFGSDLPTEVHLVSGGSSRIDQDKHNTPTAIESEDDKDEKNANSEGMNESSSGTNSQLGKRKQLLPPLSLSEVKELASMFCRVMSVETIKKQWEEQREKLVLDYKKKTRESKKKGISKITSTAAAALLNNSSSDNRASHLKRSTGKARGGVKHSKKKKQ